MKTLLLMLAGLLAITLWTRHENVKLSRSFERANQVALEQKNTILALNHQLLTAQRIARANDSAQARLSAELAAVGLQATKREALIGRLVNENEDLRRWYSRQLPDAVRRLHVRTGCDSAAHCLQRLPEGEFLPNARK